MMDHCLYKGSRQNPRVGLLVNLLRQIALFFFGISKYFRIGVSAAPFIVVLQAKGAKLTIQGWTIFIAH